MRAPDVDNRLVSYNGAAVASDPDGNTLQAPLNGTLLGPLTWDARNRLIGAGGASYIYDQKNRRSSRTIDGQTTTYTWSRGTLDRLLVKTNPDGSITRYIHGLGLIYEETTPSGGGATTLQFYHFNWQGSTMALTDANGNVTARLCYSPYGELTIVSGTPNTPFLFNGQFGVMTEPNGLYCLQARLYSPIFRRFLSEDPAGFGGGINLYAYTGGDPVNLMDPFGLGPVNWREEFVNGLPDWALYALASIHIPQGLVDFSAGAGDVLSFRYTDMIRDLDGSNSMVQKDSGWYQSGQITGHGVGIGLTGGAITANAPAIAAGLTTVTQSMELGATYVIAAGYVAGKEAAMRPDQTIQIATAVTDFALGNGAGGLPPASPAGIAGGASDVLGILHLNQ